MTSFGADRIVVQRGADVCKGHRPAGLPHHETDDNLMILVEVAGLPRDNQFSILETVPVTNFCFVPALVAGKAIGLRLPLNMIVPLFFINMSRRGRLLAFRRLWYIEQDFATAAMFELEGDFSPVRCESG